MTQPLDDDVVLLAHGGGCLLTRQLLERVVLPPLRNPVLDTLDDGACIPTPGPDLVLTTDSFVVDPLFFPGGDIGRLAACGTINDLAMQGAAPVYLTLGLILEEGLPLADLRRAIASFADVLRETGACVAAGDTKVVPRGKGGGLFITTAGLGRRRAGTDLHVRNARPGDTVLITGTIGDHGIAVLSRREGLAFDTDLRSDVAPLWDLIRTVLDASLPLHALRDPTRGGLTAALCDVAETARVCVRLDERSIPILPPVRGACRLLGLDALNVANEGKALILCPATAAQSVLDTLRRHPLGRQAAIIGHVEAAPVGAVVLETESGGERLLALPAGEELPRIC